MGDRASLAPLSVDFETSAERPAILVGALAVSDATAAGGDLVQPLVREVEQRRAGVLVLDGAALVDDDVVAQAVVLRAQGVRVCSLVGFYEEWLGRLPATELERAWLLTHPGADRQDPLKRLIDLVAATAGLILLALVMPIVLIGNAFLGNKGPLLVRQKRVGRDGKRFELLRFRTTLPAPSPSSAPASGSTETGQVSTRSTAFGRFLHSTHLDLLPRMINILSGDLSLVGPVPEHPRRVKEIQAELPFYDLRHAVRPGLTGWAQVKCDRNAVGGQPIHELQYDFTYLRHRNLRFDARVLVRAVRLAYRRRDSGGERLPTQPGASTRPWAPTPMVRTSEEVMASRRSRT